MKNILLIAAFSILSFSLEAQNVRMGILVNPQLTWLTPSGSDAITNQGAKGGIDIGLSIEKYFTDNYAFLTGLSLSNQGGTIQFADSLVAININDETETFTNNDDLEFSLQYIKLPLALKFRTREIGYLTYFAQIGMEMSVNVKANLTVEEYDVTDESVADEFSLFNAGYLIGGGAEYSLGGTSSIVIGIQYQNGFLDVLNTTSAKVVTPKLSLLLGIMF